MRFQSLAIVGSVMSLTGFLAGCGDSSPAKPASSSDARGVIASAADCVSFGADAVKACANAIERAVDRHEASSASYTNLQVCEKDVGADKCERAASGHYRARLSAFMVTIGNVAHAEPLYPVKDGGVGFQDAGKSKYLADDRSVVFSSLARSVAEKQAHDASGRKG